MLCGVMKFRATLKVLYRFWLTVSRYSVWVFCWPEPYPTTNEVDARMLESARSPEGVSTNLQDGTLIYLASNEPSGGVPRL